MDRPRLYEMTSTVYYYHYAYSVYARWAHHNYITTRPVRGLAVKLQTYQANPPELRPSSRAAHAACWCGGWTKRLGCWGYWKAMFVPHTLKRIIHVYICCTHAHVVRWARWLGDDEQGCVIIIRVCYIMWRRRRRRFLKFRPASRAPLAGNTIGRPPRPENDTKKFQRSDVFKNVHRIALPTIYYTGTPYNVYIYNKLPYIMHIHTCRVSKCKNVLIYWITFSF